MNLHLLDGSAYIHRAFHAWPRLTRKSDGLPVGAILGFCEFLWYVIRKPTSERTHLAVVMDAGHSGRKELYRDYKAHRSPRDPDLAKQFDHIDDACAAFGVPIVRVSGFEADDVMATLATMCSALGGKTYIHSGDKDLMQLVSDSVSLFDPMKKVHIGHDEVMAKWGVPPNLVPHVQALLGDAVDGIPGVPKCGDKGARALIQQHGSLEAVLAAAHAISQPCGTPLQRKNLVLYAADARLSLQLATLRRDVPLDINFDSLLTVERDYRPIFDFCEAMEFEDLVNRVSQQAA